MPGVNRELLEKPASREICGQDSGGTYNGDNQADLNLHLGYFCLASGEKRLQSLLALPFTSRSYRPFIGFLLKPHGCIEKHREEAAVGATASAAALLPCWAAARSVSLDS